MDTMESEQVYYYPASAVEGELTVHTSAARKSDGYRTLDEPVRETVWRDMKAVGVKFYHVLYPKRKDVLLRDWDLWGPLVLCVFLALVLRAPETVNNRGNDGGLQFTEIFVIVWLGAFVVTLNSKLIGGRISFLQSVCVIGYCLLAPSIALLLNLFVALVFRQGLLLFLIKFFFSMAGFIWATIAATVFLGDSQPPRRRALAVFPICLFYFIISWLIISRAS